MSDRDEDDSVMDELSEEADDLEDAAKNRETLEQGDSMFDRISDAVEDVVPGDSDHDGH